MAVDVAMKCLTLKRDLLIIAIITTLKKDTLEVELIEMFLT